MMTNVIVETHTPVHHHNYAIRAKFLFLHVNTEKICFFIHKTNIFFSFITIINPLGIVT